MGDGRGVSAGHGRTRAGWAAARPAPTPPSRPPFHPHLTLWTHHPQAAPVAAHPSCNTGTHGGRGGGGGGGNARGGLGAGQARPEAPAPVHACDTHTRTLTHSRSPNVAVVVAVQARKGLRHPRAPLAVGLQLVPVHQPSHKLAATKGGRTGGRAGQCVAWLMGGCRCPCTVHTRPVGVCARVQAGGREARVPRTSAGWSHRD